MPHQWQYQHPNGQAPQARSRLTSQSRRPPRHLLHALAPSGRGNQRLRRATVDTAPTSRSNRARPPVHRPPLHRYLTHLHGYESLQSFEDDSVARRKKLYSRPRRLGAQVSLLLQQPYLRQATRHLQYRGRLSQPPSSENSKSPRGDLEKSRADKACRRCTTPDFQVRCARSRSAYASRNSLDQCSYEILDCPLQSFSFQSVHQPRRAARQD